MTAHGKEQGYRLVELHLDGVGAIADGLSLGVRVLANIFSVGLET